MKRILLATLILCLLTAFSSAMAEEEVSLFSRRESVLADADRAELIDLSSGSAVIRQSGTYVLRGTLEDGSITVAPTDEGVVYLLLDGAHVTNPRGAALTSLGCKLLVITLADGSENSLTQGGDEPDAEDSDAAIFSHDDLTFNGTGALTVTGGWCDGVNCRDALHILGGQITIHAVQDGMLGKDEVIIGDGSITVTTQQGDALKATNKDGGERGFVTIAGGNITLSAGVGLAADDEDANPKGVKAVTTLTMTGGTVTVDAADDALHAGGAVTIMDGAVTLRSGDEGIQSDELLVISGGTLHVSAKGDCLDAPGIMINGGSIRLDSAK